MSEVHGHHHTALANLLYHPTSGNVEWHHVLTLLREIGKIEEEHNGKVRITVGEQTIIVSPPRHKDIDEDLLVELRRIVRPAV